MTEEEKRFNEAVEDLEKAYGHIRNVMDYLQHQKIKSTSLTETKNLNWFEKIKQVLNRKKR